MSQRTGGPLSLLLEETLRVGWTGFPRGPDGVAGPADNGQRPDALALLPGRSTLGDVALGDAARGARQATCRPPPPRLPPGALARPPAVPAAGAEASAQCQRPAPSARPLRLTGRCPRRRRHRGAAPRTEGVRVLPLVSGSAL